MTQSDDYDRGFRDAHYGRPFKVGQPDDYRRGYNDAIAAGSDFDDPHQWEDSLWND